MDNLSTEIEVSPEKMHGVSVLRGTRFPVSQVFAELAGCRDIGSIAEDFNLDVSQLRRLLDDVAKYCVKVE